MTVRIDHINMSVRNLEETIQWYKKVFGFEKVEQGLASQGRKYAILALNDNMLAIHEAADKKAANPNHQDPRYQIYHFGLRIDNIVEWEKKIEEYEIKVSYGGSIEYPSSRSWYVVDPSGHEIEVSYSGGRPLQFPG